MLSKTRFRRSMSSTSTTSRDSSASSASSDNTSLTSLESNDLSSTLKPDDYSLVPQKAPLLSLPVELIQQITAYLDTATAASFCLSSRHICYSIGTNMLVEYIDSSRSKFERRRKVEDIVERAFPNHWFCAWCDKFHAWDVRTTGPKMMGREVRRDCAEFNSCLYAGGQHGSHGRNAHGKERDMGKQEYTLCHHHIRLAINHTLYGPEHGIPLSSLEYAHTGMARIHRTPVPTKLSIETKIVNTRVFLHATFSLILPTWTTLKRDILSHIWPLLPHILAHHRDSDSGHTGLMAAVDNVVRRNWTYYHTQNCGNCSTDWMVQCVHFPHATGAQSRLVVQTWRDLGDGRNPFDTRWRAHGGFIKGLERLGSDGGTRCSNVLAGDVRKAFEMGGGNTLLVEKVERAASLGRTRIYRAFMRRGESASGDGGGGGDGGDVVRRSRARPRTWRTASENEEAMRRDEDERMEVSRRVVEEMARMDMQRLG